MLSNWILSFYNLNKWKIILPHTHTKLTFFFFSLLYLVLRNKLLLTTFSNNYGGVMLGYPDKRTSLPSLLVASKVSTAPSNTSFFFFFFWLCSYLILSGSVLRQSVPQAHDCTLGNFSVSTGLFFLIHNDTMNGIRVSGHGSSCLWSREMLPKKKKKSK